MHTKRQSWSINWHFVCMGNPHHDERGETTITASENKIQACAEAPKVISKTVYGTPSLAGYLRIKVIKKVGDPF